MITTPEDVKSFFSEPRRRRKAWASNGGWFFAQLLGSCMGLVNGEAWSGLRSQFESSFAHRAIVFQARDIARDAQSYVGNLLSSAVPDDPVHVSEAFMKYPFFVTAHALYGPLELHKKEELWSIGLLRAGLMGYVIRGGIFRSFICQWGSRSALKDLRDFQTRWRDFNASLLLKPEYFLAPSTVQWESRPWSQKQSRPEREV